MEKSNPSPIRFKRFTTFWRQVHRQRLQSAANYSTDTQTVPLFIWNNPAAIISGGHLRVVRSSLAGERCVGSA
ncbi:hypothetical protein CEXT_616061 [Caerostris extrusa]|uniref:Uncharacterized protein n=1 Tax=Caerostris extrusa TaxID=172846 RepID=A0AAV4SN79_CAEEX|nr:hypothetical protein CEXT_616061 [Caerostris extrusa]